MKIYRNREKNIRAYSLISPPSLYRLNLTCRFIDCCYTYMNLV